MSKFYSRKEIINNSNITLVDHRIIGDKRLDMFCYNKCNDSSDDIVKNSRGIVFYEDEYVMSGFGYTKEYNENNLDEISNFLCDSEYLHVYESHEGAIIRLFYFNGEWVVCTHRKLDAYKSKWSCDLSFGELFELGIYNEYNNNELTREEVMNLFMNNLNKNLSYMFLVSNNSQNRIVCKSEDDNKVYFVGTFDKEHNFSLDNDTKLSKPRELNLSNVKDIVEYVKNCDVYKIQGVICFNDKGNQIKILNSLYQELFLVRNNQPNIIYRYLQVRNDERIVKKLRELYPDSCKEFDNYENYINKIGKNIHHAYLQRYINKKYISLPKEEYMVMKLSHEYYFKDMVNNIVTENIILKFLNLQETSSLNKMINRYKILYDII